MDKEVSEDQMANKVCLVIKSSPYRSGRAAEGLRLATAMVAMNVIPRIIFIDDGVFCLLKDQKPEAAGSSSFLERLKTVADLIGVHAVSDSMVKRNLKGSDLDSAFNAETMSLNEAAERIAEAEATITF